MGLKREIDKINANFIVLIIFAVVCCLITSVIIYDVREYQEHRETEIKIDSLEGTNRICTATINAKFIVCPGSFAESLYNISEEKINELIKDCPDGKIINAPYCVGEYVEIS